MSNSGQWIRKRRPVAFRSSLTRARKKAGPIGARRDGEDKDRCGEGRILYRLERAATVCFVQVTKNSNNLVYRLEMAENSGKWLAPIGWRDPSGASKWVTKIADAVTFFAHLWPVPMR